MGSAYTSDAAAHAQYQGTVVARSESIDKGTGLPGLEEKAVRLAH